MSKTDYGGLFVSAVPPVGYTSRSFGYGGTFDTELSQRYAYDNPHTIIDRPATHSALFIGRLCIHWGRRQYHAGETFAGETPISRGGRRRALWTQERRSPTAQPPQQRMTRDNLLWHVRKISAVRTTDSSDKHNSLGSWKTCTWREPSCFEPWALPLLDSISSTCPLLG